MTVQHFMVLRNSNRFSVQFLILEAVRCKFKPSPQQLEIEWPNIHEAILNKRRNWKRITPQSNTGNTTVFDDSNELQK